MYKECKTIKSKERQRHIIDTFILLLEETKTPTISDICRKADIPRRAFYRYFDNINDIYPCLGELISQDMLKYMKPYLNKRIDVDTLSAYFDFWKNNKKLIHLIRKNGISSDIFQPSVYKAAELLKEDLEVSKYQIAFYLTGLISMVYIWDDNNYDMSTEELARMFLRYINRL